MKWVNIGTLCGFDLYSGSQMASDSYSQTGVGLYLRASNYAIKTLEEEVEECWLSFDARQTGTSGDYNYYAVYGFDNADSTTVNKMPALLIRRSATYQVTPIVGIVSYSYGSRTCDKPLYTPEVTWNFSDKKYHNIEIHVKTGDSGRIDVWFDHKLSFSWRSPTAFKDMKIKYCKLLGDSGVSHDLSSFIMQDTRRIGYEKFVKLTLDPDTEQSMENGSTTSFTVSGVPEATEYSDITGICAVMQPTSRDANISTGTYTLNGASIGSVDVTDSSGNAYETVLSTANSSTGLAWTRDDIEGKILALTVD